MIEFKDITKTFILGSEPVHALKGVTLSIEQGEYVAIMGTSGSGKSTMMHIIGCLDKPTSGEYILDSQAVQGLSEDELAVVRNQAIGFIFQQFNLLPQMTALQNVVLPLTYAGMPKSQRISRGEEVLKLVGLGDRMGHKPTQLSGGQQQRVSIARALANKPKILLADEPTGALDSYTAADIMKLIDDLVAGGMTVVLVTHDAEIAAHARRIVRVKDGAVISDEINSGVKVS
ncbi:MAG: ABC transporter ATP-binding protein [Cyanobacteria bacterium SZAS LIN-3]|nr:ABC transporter ATP-binding protein [Cyanobacteria bacterium SZAS LIN-3]MBS2005558.1 ABC transporter ATP-binding protein [Cyanobacteria bacterium SZAS TMP-1]